MWGSEECFQPVDVSIHQSMFMLASLAPHIATARVLRLIFWGAAAGKVVGMAGVRGAVCSEPGCDNTDGEVRAPLGALGEWFLASHLVSQQYHITPYLTSTTSRVVRQ